MQKSTIFWIFLVFLLAHTNCSIYEKYFQEAMNIASSMTLKQKIGQTIQTDFYSITNRANGTDPKVAERYFIGSLLVGGNGFPDEKGNMVDTPATDQAKTVELYKTATLEKWQTLANKFNYAINVQTKDGKQYSILPLLATDAVHNNQHVVGTILFPHNIGLSCSHNPQNFQNVGKWTAFNVKKSGFNYAFSPTVAVSHNPQWGRYYQTMGQQSDYIRKYGYSFVKGLQQVQNNRIQGVLASVKHFIGDGATQYGADEGSASVGSYKSFIDHNIQGYIGSSNAQVGSVMCTYSSINYVPISISPHMIALLRQEVHFDGFIISDYDQLNKIAQQNMPTDFLIMKRNQAYSMGTNAGIDMWMLPAWHPVSQYIQSVQYALGNKTITEDRITQAVARILSVKMAMGLVKSNNVVDKQNTEKNQKQIIKGSSQYQDALTAVHESLVLLQNKDNLLPLKIENLQYIVLVGQRIININNLAKNQLFASYDNIGMQSGGWSVRWQGFQGNSMWQGSAKTQANASSILDALKSLNKSFKLVYPNYTTYKDVQTINRQRNQFLQQLKTLRQSMNSKNTIILGVLGQSPYAQFSGDINIPYCKNQTVISDKGCLYDGNNNPYLPDKQKTTLKVDYEKFDKQIISSIQQKDKAIPLVTVLLAGRPLLINDVLTESSAVLDAFLPGTAGGQGIVNALTGSYVIRPNGDTNEVNSLSFDWPKSMDQLNNFPIYRADGQIPKIEDPLFKVGFGLSTSIKQQIKQNDM